MKGPCVERPFTKNINGFQIDHMKGYYYLCFLNIFNSKYIINKLKPNIFPVYLTEYQIL